MSHSFTIIPKQDFWALAKRIVDRAAFDRAIVVVASGPDTTLFFCGNERIARSDWLANGEGAGFACVRILSGSYVINVDLEGYEGSVAHLQHWLAHHSKMLSPFVVLDDETGLDLSWEFERLPHKLFESPSEFKSKP